MAHTPTPEIRAYFDQRLLAAIPSLEITTDQVAWFNTPFSPNVDEPYLEPFILYSPTVPTSFGDDGFEQLSGLYQINVQHVKGQGAGPAERIARDLVDEFRGGQRHEADCFTLIIRTAYSGNPVSDNDRLFTPVSVVWLAYVQK